MAKNERVPLVLQDTALQAGLKVISSRTGYLVEQTRISRGTDDGRALEERPGAGWQPPGARQHGVAHSLRNLTSGGDHRGDEEWIAAGPLKELLGIDSAARGQGSDGRRGQRRHGEPVHRGCRR